ncbi:MAG: SusD/RagB family nutrient-binding outer membrane lipoprotein [Tannerellaceae bacterium]|jgi:hypothetical protein|nr:SusD/RagB family nutrient-binding outer membrane lipoprotein [Tannerellaceae bacterium]
MNKKIKLWVATLFLFATVLVAGCTDSFEEINTDPDAFDEAPYTNMLADAIREVGTRMGGEIEGYGTWSGYITKIQYMDYMGGINPTNNTYGNRWSRCYTNIYQLNDILKRTEENAGNLKNIRFVARIWQQYMWSYLLDGWGDIPYSEAIKGADEDGAILTPKYDKEQDIWPAVMADLKTIADEMAAGLGSDDIGDGDFIYSGDVKKWQRFCNSLRLRMAMRISGVSSALSKSTIEEICGNPSKYPFIDSTDSQCYLWWQGTPPYYEEWYKNKLSRDDHGVSELFIDHLKAMDDPRIASIAHPAESDGEYRGYPNGPAEWAVLNTISRIGTIYRDDPAGFTPFYNASESYFVVAEAALNGWSTGITAAEAYEKAVRLSMEENKIDAADADTYLAGKGKFDNTKDRLYWEFWVSLFKNNYEGWSLYRRTGYPTTNYPAIESVWKGTHNDMPFRLPYPNNEELYNVENCKAAKVGIVDYCWGRQLWWDTRTGVN